MTQFKVDDRVRLTGTNTGYDGRSGTVVNRLGDTEDFKALLEENLLGMAMMAIVNPAINPDSLIVRLDDPTLIETDLEYSETHDGTVMVHPKGLELLVEDPEVQELNALFNGS